MTKIRASLLAVLPLAAAGIWWFGHASPSEAAPGPTARPPARLVAPGRVEPERDPVALAFEAPGRIAEIDVDEGDAVAAGQVIARLDDRLARARVAAAKAGVAQAEARLALARRGPRREELAAARADADAAGADAEHRAVEQARSARLGDSGAVATSIVDADAAAARMSASTAEASRARYAALAAGTRTEVIAESAATVDAARAELAAAEVALDQTVLRAPSAGVVLRRLAEPGALVTTMSPLPIVTVADLTHLEVRAEIDEADIARVATGTAAYVTADAYGDRTFPVHLGRITRELGRKTVRDDDPRARVDTRVLEVVVRFDAPADVPLGLRMIVHLPD